MGNAYDPKLASKSEHEPEYEYEYEYEYSLRQFHVRVEDLPVIIVERGSGIKYPTPD
jgi:hypothetical protein